MVKKAQRLSVFELDALREAFKLSIRKQGTTPVDWEACAKRFLRRTLRAEASRRSRINNVDTADPPSGV
ncbi:hypothetical protein LB553_05490 [Mesorhizobium sp. CA8]|uniref:hypothetical protein n=1 Tax=Mesorhizobium sp. CA8 TaxID=2876637 RepID=UPI001CCCA05E|nr:hypothetical protein [Mesorhizobium sp. CA8]MBZ9760328.1 hypothetical protein [Mesorhizobium sp. CA8]